MNAKGFYFVEPSTPVYCRIHIACVYAFYPLIWFEATIGTGRPPAALPLRDLSIRNERALVVRT